MRRELGDFLWPVYVVTLFVFFYGLVLLVRLYRTRNLWRSGEIVPAVVVTPARMPHLPLWLNALLVSFAVPLWVTQLESDVALGAAIGVSYLALTWLINRLNSARIFFVQDGEELLGLLPTEDHWRKLEAGENLYVTAIGSRAAVLHVVAPAPFDELEPDGASIAKVNEQYERLLAEIDEEQDE
ncbi:MAG: hypothetical protein R3E76_00675 [Planctomycetota bacterium]